MSAVVKAHTHNRITRLTDRELHCHICLRAGMRLNVGIFTAEQLFSALPCQLLDFVYDLAAAIIALAGIALSVFVGQH